MSTFEKLNELNVRRSAIEMGSGGQLSARERIKTFLDTNSFVESGIFVTHRSTDFNLPEKETPADGVVTGYGTVEGRLVYIYSQDITVLGGSIGEMNAKKIGKIYKQALKMGAAVVGILDSKGIRLQEGLDSLEGYGEIFKYQSMASGVIPQISVVLGNSLGMNSIIPALSDFVFMEQKNSRIFLNSPNTIDGIEAKVTTFENIGSAETHSKESGLAHFCFETEDACLNGVRDLLSLLPSNNLEDAPLHGMADDLNRTDQNLNNIIFEEAVDVRNIISSISDNARFLEVKKDYATNIVVCFARFNGYTAGIIANQSIEDKGQLDIKACNKAVEFITFCDAFNIPIITLTDTIGFKSALKEELNGISKSIAKLTYSFINSTVPKINVIIRQAFGNAYISMNSKHIGADIVYSWPDTQISLIEAEAAINIIYNDELKNSDREQKIQQYRQNQASPYTAAKRGYIDDIIEPAETRKYLIAALEMLESKRESRPAKKHGSINL